MFLFLFFPMLPLPKHMDSTRVPAIVMRQPVTKKLTELFACS